ncbi:MAG: hypothetical protein CVT98_03335 [Bacteroidetes bacterium HGW-Bacteroidetes-15]|nr:MAG: hypothetical protein CVT98_03335 [Bacteroidetes bacterium HGW-Bacteroidetes-15]
MKRIVLKSLVILSIITFSISVNAQQKYKTALGLRGGYPSGVTGKHFISNTNAIEGIVTFGGWGGFGVTGLYQIHNPIPDAPGFNWYYGGGAHIATAVADKANPWSNSTGGKLFLGVDGILGAEYVFEEAPISLSLDVLPILNIVEDIGVWFNAGFSIRYTFK